MSPPIKESRILTSDRSEILAGLLGAYDSSNGLHDTLSQKSGPLVLLTDFANALNVAGPTFPLPVRQLMATQLERKKGHQVFALSESLASMKYGVDPDSGVSYQVHALSPPLHFASDDIRMQLVQPVIDMTDAQALADMYPNQPRQTLPPVTLVWKEGEEVLTVPVMQAHVRASVFPQVARVSLAGDYNIKSLPYDMPGNHGLGSDSIDLKTLFRILAIQTERLSLAVNMAKLTGRVGDNDAFALDRNGGWQSDDANIHGMTLKVFASAHTGEYYEYIVAGSSAINVIAKAEETTRKPAIDFIVAAYAASLGAVDQSSIKDLGLREIIRMTALLNAYSDMRTYMKEVWDNGMFPIVHKMADLHFDILTFLQQRFEQANHDARVMIALGTGSETTSTKQLALAEAQSKGVNYIGKQINNSFDELTNSPDFTNNLIQTNHEFEQLHPDLFQDVTVFVGDKFIQGENPNLLQVYERMATFAYSLLRNIHIPFAMTSPGRLSQKDQMPIPNQGLLSWLKNNNESQLKRRLMDEFPELYVSVRELSQKIASGLNIGHPESTEVINRFMHIFTTLFYFIAEQQKKD